MELLNKSVTTVTNRKWRLSAQQSSQALAVERCYGSASDFLLTFNPDTQRTFGKLDCINGKSATPKLFQLRWAYGDAVAEVWLVAQLTDLNKYAGVRNKLTEFQIEQCAQVIIDTYGYLTVGEMMLFFLRFKAGKYGRFYGDADPLVITEGLNDFLDDRKVELQRLEAEYQRKQQQIVAQRREPAITGREFCRLKGLPETDDIMEIYANYIKKYGNENAGTDDSRPSE